MSLIYLKARGSKCYEDLLFLLNHLGKRDMANLSMQDSIGHAGQ